MEELIVIKIGGSFINTKDADKLKKIIEIIERTALEAKNKKFIIVNGGGKSADLVRDFDNLCQLQAKSSHFAAIAAVELNAYLISDFFEDFSFFSKNKFLQSNLNIFLPLLYYENFDPLPHSWQVTSDSMALETAARFNADRLILLKQKDFADNNDLISEKAEDLSESGLIDAYFPKLYRESKENSKDKMETVIINANYPQRIKEYIKYKKTSMIKII